MARAIKFLSKDDILRAQKNTLSNKAAARYLRVSYVHYKKYARTYVDDETGLNLLEKHKNESGKGIPKFLLSSSKEPKLLDVLEGRVPIFHFSAQRIKQRILEEGLLDPECNNCGFRERRLVDQRVPLILTHINGNKSDFGLENLEMLCYNCAFLYGKSPITDEQVELMEGYKEIPKSKEFNWEMDEFHLEHLKSLGLIEEDKKNTKNKYISRL
jgi:hypothetical protein